MTGGPHIETMAECEPITGEVCDHDDCATQYLPVCCTNFALKHRILGNWSSGGWFSTLTDARLALANHLTSEHGMNVPADQLPVWPTGEGS